MLTKYTAYAKEYIQSVLPKKLSQLTNDVGYITKSSDISGTAAMAIADKDGNPITTTYEKKVDAQIALIKKADKATTLSGYGITDSYTKTEEDTKLKNKADAANVYTKQQILDKLDLKADKAITLAGYYIGDAYTKTEVDDKLAKKADLESLHMADVLSAIDARLKKTDAEATYVKKTEKGIANGIATLDSSGLVPSSQLPSYVDDVVEGYYNSTDNKFYKEETHTTVLMGEDGKIYVDIPSNHSFRYAPASQAYIKIDDAVSTAERALKDSDGNDINATYEKKADAVASLAKKADKSTTLSGYEITDAYTKIEIDTKLDTKANSSYVSGQFSTISKSIDTINNNISENSERIDTLRSDINNEVNSITTRLATNKDTIAKNTADIANINKQISDNQASASSTYVTKTELADKTKPATTTSLGTVIIGDNLTVDANGRVSAKNSYVLPIATTSVLGGVKQGTDITIDKDGILSINYIDFTANCTEENFAKLYAES